MLPRSLQPLQVSAIFATYPHKIYLFLCKLLPWVAIGPFFSWRLITRESSANDETGEMELKKKTLRSILNQLPWRWLPFPLKFVSKRIELYFFSKKTNLILEEVDSMFIYLLMLYMYKHPLTNALCVQGCLSAFKKIRGKLDLFRLLQGDWLWGAKTKCLR